MLKKNSRLLRSIRSKTEEDIALDKLLKEVDDFVTNLKDPELTNKWEKSKARSYEKLRYKDSDYAAFIDKTDRNLKGRLELNIGPLKFIDDLIGGGMDSTIVLSKRITKPLKGRLPPMTLRYAQRRRSKKRKSSRIRFKSVFK
tara:strand:+ start:143 stop:571 length:429 start_codon:yes stop_codon:yes gene_type:complete